MTLTFDPVAFSMLSLSDMDLVVLRSVSLKHLHWCRRYEKRIHRWLTHRRTRRKTRLPNASDTPPL